MLVRLKAVVSMNRAAHDPGLLPVLTRRPIAQQMKQFTPSADIKLKHTGCIFLLAYRTMTVNSMYPIAIVTSRCLAMHAGDLC